eukprot:GFYU01003831.1.p1 GENE.GFYU01003831.1~~GFYU01003831.1.p1  ORF type:complete len:136 (+),score=4.06 GFYU01003831.1:61-408(+)
MENDSVICPGLKDMTILFPRDRYSTLDPLRATISRDHDLCYADIAMFIYHFYFTPMSVHEKRQVAMHTTDVWGYSRRAATEGDVLRRDVMGDRMFAEGLMKCDDEPGTFQLLLGS